MKKPSLSAAKKKAWAAFSAYIRTRDCLKTTGHPGRGVCCTCQREYPYKSLQAGHFITGRTNAVLFDEVGVNAQCYACNIGRGGAHVEYFVFMERRYGRQKIDELRAKRRQAVKYGVADYERIGAEYGRKLQSLMEAA